MQYTLKRKGARNKNNVQSNKENEQENILINDIKLLPLPQKYFYTFHILSYSILF